MTTLTNRRETTKVRPPRTVPFELEKARPEVPEVEPPTHRPRLVRWLSWMAAIILVVAVTIGGAMLLTGSDETIEPSVTITEQLVGPPQHLPGFLPTDSVTITEQLVGPPQHLPGFLPTESSDANN